jgi:hypothetical protein
MNTFLSVFLPRSLTRLADGSYVVLNGEGRVLDPIGSVVTSTREPGLRVRIEPMPPQLADGPEFPDVIWLYETDNPPAPASDAWLRYTEKLGLLATCAVADAAEDSRYVVVPGYGRFLARHR